MRRMSQPSQGGYTSTSDGALGPALLCLPVTQSQQPPELGEVKEERQRLGSVSPALLPFSSYPQLCACCPGCSTSSLRLVSLEGPQRTKRWPDSPGHNGIITGWPEGTLVLPLYSQPWATGWQGTCPAQLATFQVQQKGTRCFLNSFSYLQSAGTSNKPSGSGLSLGRRRSCSLAQQFLCAGRSSCLTPFSPFGKAMRHPVSPHTPPHLSLLLIFPFISDPVLSHLPFACARHCPSLILLIPPVSPAES